MLVVSLITHSWCRPRHLCVQVKRCQQPFSLLIFHSVRGAVLKLVPALFSNVFAPDVGSSLTSRWDPLATWLEQTHCPTRLWEWFPRLVLSFLRTLETPYRGSKNRISFGIVQEQISCAVGFPHIGFHWFWKIHCYTAYWWKCFKSTWISAKCKLLTQMYIHNPQMILRGSGVVKSRYISPSPLPSLPQASLVISNL